MYRKIIYVSFNFHNSSRTFLLKRPCRATSMKLHFYGSMKEKINHSATTIWSCLQKMYSRKQEMFKAITSPNISQHHSQTPDVTRVSGFEPATAHYLSHNLFRPIIYWSRETISVMDKNGMLLAVISCLWRVYHKGLPCSFRDTLLAVVCLFMIHNVIINWYRKKCLIFITSHRCYQFTKFGI